MHRRLLSSLSAAACTLPRVQWSDEALMTCVQSYFAAYSPVSAPQQQPLPRVVPLPGSAIPQLHDLSLWELVRLLKVMEDMTTVSAFPRLRTELLLRHAVRLIAALPWGAGTAPEDAAALHALAVHFADRAVVTGGSGSSSSGSAGGEGGLSEEAGGDDFKRIQNVCKQHLCPAIAALLECRAWPAVAVADIAHTLGPRRLLSSAATGALVRYVAAALGSAGGAEAECSVDLLLGLCSCLELAEAGEQEEGGAAGSGGGQSEVDAVFRASAPALAQQLLQGAGSPAALPMATLAALASALCDRFDGHGRDAPEEGSSQHQGLAALAEAIGTCAHARLQASDSAASGAPAEQESALALHSLSIGRSLACMGVWHAPLLGLLGAEWGRKWGRAFFATLLPTRAAADALLLASLCAAVGAEGLAGAPPFPPPPGRLQAGWKDSSSSKILLLLNGQGKGFHARPMLPRPFQLRPAEAAFVKAFAAAWEECRSSSSSSSGSAQGEVLRHAPQASFVTPEGCVLDIAVPGAQCGVRIVRGSSDYRPGRGGLKASLLAEQLVLESAGWSVEFVLEADLAKPAKAAQAARGLLAAEVERRARQARW